MKKSIVESIIYKSLEIHRSCRLCNCHCTKHECEHDAIFIVGGILYLCNAHFMELESSMKLHMEKNI